MITLSASKISTFLACPRKYKFRYVLRLPTPWKAAALGFGSAMHATLEEFHRQRAADRSMSPDAVAGLFRIDWAAQQLDDLRFKDEGASELGVAGEQLARMYALQNQGLEVRAVETPFELRLLDGVVLRGVFDVVLTNDRIRELKTAARNFDEGTLARHVQLSAYAFSYAELFGREPVLEVVALLKVRQPRIAIHEVTRTSQERAWFVELAGEVAQAIAAGAFPPNPSWACSDCEYRDACGPVERR